jgi:hypothetical protein
MARLNAVVLKLRSLYTWRDPPRSRAFVVALLLAALVVSVVPARVLFTLFVLAQFTKPLRSRKAGLTTIALRRFWDGLPVPSVSDPVYAPLPPDGSSSPVARARAGPLAALSGGGEDDAGAAPLPAAFGEDGGLGGSGVQVIR